MSGSFSGKALIVPTLIAGMAVVTVASAQTSNSPFAKKTKRQAWELAPPSVQQPQPAQRQTPPPQYAPPETLPGQPVYQLPAQSAPVPSVPSSHQSRTYGGQPASAPPVLRQSQPRPYAQTSTTAGSAYNYQAQPQTPAPQYYGSQSNSAPQPSYSGQRPTTAPQQDGAYYPGRTNGGQAFQQNYGSQYQQPAQVTSQNPYYNNQGAYGQSPQAYYPGQNQAYNQAPPQSRPQKPGWKDRLGLGNIKTTLSGFFKTGAAAVERDGWDAEFVADGNVKAGVSAFTDGGLEYGANLELRAQYDPFRRGFGGRVGNCPAGIIGCATVDINGTPTAIRGHTSRFYTDGPGNDKDAEIALEGAYLFLRSAYGDFTVGRDDGAAYLFSLGAPTLLAVNASNSPVDYTGLDSVKTVNDASGFAEKVTYTTPRLLGDTVGLGIQLGASYAPNARACGVDYCVRSNGRDGTGVLAPDLSDIFELGVALDRKFDNGLSVEATATYARSSEDSAIAAFDGLSAYNAGLEFGYSDWTLGGSYLQSNNGLRDGDYSAYDIGVTWKPNDLGFTLGYGNARDKNIDLSSDQAVFGITYDFDKFRFGTGVQYIERSTPLWDGLVLGRDKEKSTAIFIEGGFEF